MALEIKMQTKEMNMSAKAYVAEETLFLNPATGKVVRDSERRKEKAELVKLVAKGGSLDHARAVELGLIEAKPAAKEPAAEPEDKGAKGKGKK